MKKAVVAATVLGSLGVIGPQAHAQTSVTLYGVVDTAIQYVNRMSTPTSHGSRFDMMSLGGQSGSRFGLRGTEDLGNGVQAFFWLENQFAPDSGAIVGTTSSQLFSRQAAVGLRKSGIGQVSFGRQYNSLFESMVNFLPYKTGVAYEPAITAGGGNFREDNTVKYSGEFGPAHVLAHYSFGTGFGFQGGQVSTVPEGEVPGNQRANTGFGAGAYYYGGSFGLGAGYDQINVALNATAPSGEDKRAFLAGSYSTGPVRFMGGYRWRNSTYANGGTAIRDNFYWAGVQYDVTQALGLIAGYYYDQVKGASLSPSVNATSLPNFSQVSLMANYSFSKRTNVYLVGAYSHNGALNYDSILQTGLTYGYGNATTLSGLANGQKSMVGVAAGLRVIF
ncbi:porin [Cupriavidus sp. BIS7]|uniref:porin n=1 Tax=Cupriavidus sp. BIS7 TaxID=1217718 RepID=UPI0003075D56|nr:porin [Cupriavidus sp. BIS7]